MLIVRDVMCCDVVRLRPEMSLDEAMKLLESRDCGGAPVVCSDETLCGVISELNVLDVLFDVSCRSAPVSEFMTTNVHVVEPEDSLEHAAHMFELYGIRRLPVVERDKVVGIVTRRDLIRHVLAKNESLGNPLASLLPSLAEFQLQATNVEAGFTLPQASIAT